MEFGIQKTIENVEFVLPRPTLRCQDPWQNRSRIVAVAAVCPTVPSARQRARL